MRYILLCALLSGCASADLDPVASQAQPVVTRFEAWNSTANLTVNTIQQNLCHPTYVNGSGANSQSFMLPYNVPECGGLVAISSTTISAFPNSCASNQQGSMRMKVRCEPLSDFGPVTSGSTLFSQTWNGTGQLEGFSYGQQMLTLVPTFNTYNACYLSGLGSMSVGNEYSWVNYDSTNAWLNSQGFKGLSTSGRCSRLGRAGGPVSTLHATTGSPASGPAVSTHTCLVTKVDGDIDDGGFELTETGGNWGLNVWGYVSYAGAECYAH